WGQYAWLKEGETKPLPDWLKQKLKLSELSKEHAQALEREREHKPLHVVGKWTDDELSEIAQRLRSLWLQGAITGYDVDIEGIGALIDLGLTDEQIHKVIEGVFEQEYDSRRTQYMIGRTRDIKENDGQYRGVGSLIYRLKQIENEDAKALLRLIYRHALYEPYKPVPGVDGFYTDLDERYLYRKKKDDYYVLVGIFIKPLAIWHGERAYLVYEYDGQIHKATYGDRKRLIEEVQITTGGVIVKNQDFWEFIGLYDVAYSPEKPVLRFQTGWDEGWEKFYLPQIITDKKVVFSNELRKWYKVSESNDDGLNFLRETFNEGKYLALGYILGFAAPLVAILETGNFVVF
ncbi:MAG: hypothetical protein D6699_01650, partial [Aquificota bacterium]